MRRQKLSSSAKICRLISNFSVAASMTKSQAASVGAVDGAMNAGEGGVHLGLSEFGFGDFAGEILSYGVEAAIEKTLIHLAQADIEAAARKHMRDAIAHGAGAQHADGTDLTHLFPCFHLHAKQVSVSIIQKRFL